MRARSRGPESGPLTGAPNPNCISASEHGKLSRLPYIAARPRASQKPRWPLPATSANTLRFLATKAREGRMTEMTRSHVKRETAQARAYSQAVITEGGRTIWLAGQVAIEDGAGRSLASDFDAQVRE